MWSQSKSEVVDISDEPLWDEMRGGSLKPICRSRRRTIERASKGVECKMTVRISSLDGWLDPVAVKMMGGMARRK
jgi:hypothetical protein